MDGRINFELFELPEGVADVPDEDRCAHGCHGLRLTDADANWWELEIEEGYAAVRCATCHCIFEPLMDGTDILYTDKPLPVRVIFNHCSAIWHGENRCDCGWTVTVEPR